MSARLVCITGGIGSGKSVVARICRLEGFNVYDCDLEARRIMESSEEIKTALVERFGPQALDSVSGKIDRAHIAGRVFRSGESHHLRWLNALIHGEVKRDMLLKASVPGKEVMFVETAIPMTSGIGDICSAIWWVTAPDDVRMVRVMERNGLSEEEVRKRMESQKSEWAALPLEKTDKIDNSGRLPLMPQIKALLKDMPSNKQDT